MPVHLQYLWYDPSRNEAFVYDMEIRGQFSAAIAMGDQKEDGISIGGKALREIYEVVNHKKDYDYVKNALLKISRSQKI